MSSPSRVARRLAHRTEDDGRMTPALARAHREAFLARLDGVAVISTGHEVIRNRDAHYRFRPDSDFWYLTGYAEPDAVAVFAPGRAEGRFVLFVRPRDKEMEVWNGKRAGLEGAREIHGADQAFPISRLDEELPKLLKGTRRLHYRTGLDPDFDRKLLGWLHELRLKTRDGDAVPGEVVDPGVILHEMRLIKSASELAVMRRAAAITGAAHRAAMESLRPGQREHEIEALVDGTFRRLGGWGPGYTSIVAAGANACILHSITNCDAVKPGDLLLLDAGCEADGYTADVTRTFPADGRLDGPQRALYDVVLAAQLRGIAQVAPGHAFHSVHEEATRVLVEGMLGLGLLTGSIDENLRSGAYKRYYMHRTSHWLGLDVHDVGAYWIHDGHGGKRSRPLAPGMVLTVEPGIYVALDDDQAPARFRGIGLRIEDDVLVTEDGREVLTADIPKTVAELEALR